MNIFKMFKIAFSTKDTSKEIEDMIYNIITSTDAELELKFSTLAESNLEELLSQLPTLEPRDLALALLSLQNATYSTIVRDTLTNALNSKFPEVREGAIYALGSFLEEDKTLIPILIAKLHSDTNWAIKQAIRSVLYY